MASFWRGVVDGDGSVMLTRGRRYPCISLVGASRALLNQFVAFLARRGLVAKNRSGGSGRWQVAVYGESASRLAKILYTKTGPALARKRKTANKLMKND